MNIRPLAITEAYSSDLNETSNHAEAAVFSTPLSKAIVDNFPDFLSEFAKREKWEYLQLDDVLKNTIPNSDKCFYLEQVLVKSADPNTLFCRIRKTLSGDKYFAFKVVTAENVKQQIRANFPVAIFPAYYLYHFLLRRVFPKLKGLRKLSRLLSIPVDMSRAEIMGRLIYNGYKIVQMIDIPSATVFITTIDTEHNPSQTNPASNEGFLFRMKRIGKGGKDITIYKFRSMHPYAEYVQAYLHTKNGLAEGGKFKDDFRVSTGGRLIRKYWVDELPMLYNLLKGDIKLVGVRPLSAHYFALYPLSVQRLRLRHKPGLLPPFYADLPKTLDEILQSEVNYMNRYAKAPVWTDCVYLYRILKNIIVHGARSK
ncbi:sugar transferase [Spirosoma rigui]|uniref:sugar transferase n=1 Tax=Spirosoma rigui TaxID=564064 RepID=UPI0009AFB155|nr:sugar transferase [Spirosoma rigui]